MFVPGRPCTMVMRLALGKPSRRHGFPFRHVPIWHAIMTRSHLPQFRRRALRSSYWMTATPRCAAAGRATPSRAPADTTACAALRGILHRHPGRFTAERAHRAPLRTSRAQPAVRAAPHRELIHNCPHQNLTQTAQKWAGLRLSSVCVASVWVLPVQRGAAAWSRLRRQPDSRT